MSKLSSFLTDGPSNLLRFAKLNHLAKSIYEANTANPSIFIMDITNPEVQSFLQSLHDHDVKYMLVGGFATVFHGYIRTTQDLDLWIKETPENKIKLVAVLKEQHVAGAENYLNVPMIPGWSTITIGENGFVADLMGFTKNFSKTDFDKCYSHARHSKFDDVPITVIHINDLIKEKKTLGRPKDLDDVENLRRINNL